MKKLLVLMSMAILVFTACSEEPEVAIDRTDAELSYKGGECEFTVTANCDWEIVTSSDNEDLITVSDKSGPMGSQTIHIYVDKNESNAILKHYFTAVAHGKKRDALTSFTLTQGAPAYVTFNKEIFTAPYTGGTYKFVVAANFPWEITVEGEGITVEPTSGVPVIEDEEQNTTTESEEEDDEEEDGPGVITVTIDEYEGDVDRQFILTVDAEGNEGHVSDVLTITQERPLLMIGNREYPIKKMGDGRWWMVQNLYYSQKGITIGDGKCGVWYPCSDTALEFDDSSDGITTKGLIYSDETAFNANITTTTSKQMEGTQGLCPKGWHIPTVYEFMALVGKSTNPQLEVVEDAPYYDPVRKQGSLSMLEEGGFNTTMAGYVQGRSRKFESNGDIVGYNASRGFITSTYIYSSSAYISGTSTGSTMWYALIFNKTANTANVGYMSNSTTSKPFAGSVRCIKDLSYD
ncbi:MAG: hypothetical protein J6X89_06330 [Bacteroidales bacterium]|nr:hypothetical protein [Bacteroidales bacterium]